MAEDKAKGNGPDWGAITKWLVIGVVLIVLIFVLKQPLAGLVNRATNVEISSKGVKILTAQTDVGDVKYSQEKITTADVPKLESADNVKSFVSTNHYVMTWPKGIWKADNEQLARARQMYPNSNVIVDMVCTRTTPSQSGFTPNVNVVINTADPNHTMAEQSDSYKKMLIAGGANIIDEKIDEATKGALLTYTLNSEGRQLYFIQRIVTNNDKLYTITATTTLNDDQQTKNELLSILNSFKIVEG